MKKAFSILISCSFLLVSCFSIPLEYHWEQSTSPSQKGADTYNALLQQGVPRNVVNDFCTRYPGCGGVSANSWKEDNGRDLCRIYFSNSEGFSSTAYYVNQKWSATQTVLDKETFMQFLPRKVLASYLSVAPENENYDGDSDYIVFIDRTNIAHRQYEFSFKVKNENNQYLLYNILIIDDGTILESANGFFFNPVCVYDIDGSLACVRQAYPECELLGMVHNGNHLYFIRDDGAVEKVTVAKNDKGYTIWSEF